MKFSHILPHSVRSLPSALWYMFVLHMLDSFCFFAVAFNLVLYLMQEFETSTATAEFYFGAWSTMMLLFAIPTGALIDRLGLKRSLLLGSLLNTLSRLVFAFSTNLTVSMISLVLVMSFASGLFQAPLHIAVDRYSANTKIKSTGFSLLYTFSNVGAIAALFFTDFAKSLTIRMTGYRLLFVVSAGVSIFTLIIASSFQEMVQREIPRTRFNTKILLETLREKNLWFLLSFTLLILPLVGIFTFMESLLPIYMSITTPEAPISVLSVNPILIIFFAPVVGTILNSKSDYPMIVSGGFISALSVSIMFFWYGANTYFGVVIPEGVVAFQVIFTLGEAIFSPRIAQFVLEYSPSPKKGLYGGLTPLPGFAGKFIASWLSAYLLERWCSTGEPEECRTIWLPIAGLALLTPIMVSLLYLVVHIWLKVNFIVQYEFEKQLDQESQTMMERFEEDNGESVEDLDVESNFESDNDGPWTDNLTSTSED